MTWIKLPAEFDDDPRVLELGENEAAGAWLYVRSLAYSNRHGLDGHLPAGFVARADPAIVEELVRVGLWRRDDGAIVADVTHQEPAEIVAKRRGDTAKRMKDWRARKRDGNVDASRTTGERVTNGGVALSRSGPVRSGPGSVPTRGDLTPFDPSLGAPAGAKQRTSGRSIIPADHV